MKRVIEMILIIKAIPPTINKYIGRTNRWEYQKDKKEFQNIARLMTLKDRPKQPIESCKITITYYFNDKRRRDPSNFDKFVLDFLVESGFITDDNYFVIKEFTTKAYVDKDDPRTEIEIIEIEEV
ncbi:MAG TPA: RusA family crossover junction endodeoxyribonuclease [Gallicola sp.]|nr:RusA family crossover junction endodeoxyribonuclease [Gallicola sp.]